MTKIEDQEAVELLNAIRVPLTLNAIRNAEKDGLKPTFVGHYLQAPRGSQHKRTITFVLAQTPEEFRLLEEDKLKGKIYEMGIEALVTGDITLTEMMFKKTYIPETDTLGPGENHDITYQGSSNDGIVYSGKWSFESVYSEMEPSGEFVLRRVIDLSKLKTELERLCAED